MQWLGLLPHYSRFPGPKLRCWSFLHVHVRFPDSHISGQISVNVRCEKCMNVCVHDDELMSYPGCIPSSYPVFPGKTPDSPWPWLGWSTSWSQIDHYNYTAIPDRLSKACRLLLLHKLPSAMETDCLTTYFIITQSWRRLYQIKRYSLLHMNGTLSASS